MKKRIKKLLYAAILFCSFLQAGLAVEAGTIYNSPYVSFSPTGKGFTVEAGETDYTHYANGTMVSTGLTSSLRELETGEHYYKAARSGSIPIGKWVVKHSGAQCIHNAYTNDEIYLGLEYGKSNCFGYYNSGWFAYCADCGEEIVPMLVYMSKEAAETLDYLECGMGLDYYHLCPYCDNLEQGRTVAEHDCKSISWNQYIVKYKQNDDSLSDFADGYMPDSFHMYNNANVYEGKGVTPVTRLSRNAYTCMGYEFLGWNTEPDGSGTFYEDCAEIYNLTSYDYQKDEGRGIVTLYAQWKRSESTLEIDPNGGSYQGKGGITAVTQAYLTRYEIDGESILAPPGYTVSFETNGGSSVEDITGRQYFTEWSRGYPFGGRLEGEKYLFTAPDGNTDTIRANYAPDSILLPETQKENYSFGGWYYDEAFTRPAGGAGDLFLPQGDVTLYAQWVELRLSSEENYTDNDGKGAADLSWTQNDRQGKSYKLYQSSNGSEWKQINSVLDIGTELSVSESFDYTGTVQSYTIPYSGRYTLTAYGAQGGNYGSRMGGKGGKVTGSFWLTKGDVLTISVGGQNGYGDGGAGTVYGCGGGSTTVISAQNGLLMSAGGGGGATALGNGGAGGSLSSLRTDEESKGADGQAGGGGGFVGGNAGEAVIHHHNASCYQTEDISLNARYGVTALADVDFWHDGGTVSYDEDDFDEEDDYEHGVRRSLRIGNPANLIPVVSGQNLKLEAAYGATYRGETLYRTEESGISIYNQNGTRIHYYSAAQIEAWMNAQESIAMTGSYNDRLYDSCYGTLSRKEIHALDEDDDEYITGFEFGWLEWRNGAVYKNRLRIGDETYDMGGDPTAAYEHYWKNSYNAAALFYPEITYCGSQWYGNRQYIFRENYTIPEGTTGIYIEFVGEATQYWDTDPNVSISMAQLTGSRLSCGYEEGQVVSSKPAYGGSNYANGQVCSSYESTAGEREGNGSFVLESLDIGYFDSMSLTGVSAPDLEAPEAVQTSGIRPDSGERAVSMEAVEESNGEAVRITWTAPQDLGSTYYHKAESCLAITGRRLCVSNITENTLVTGVAGYYYVVDTLEDTTVTKENSNFTGKNAPTAVVALTDAVQYLHIAAADVAGNLGATSHVKVGSKRRADVEWPVFTTQLTLLGEENVYPAGENTWYVRCDDATPVTLSFTAYLEGSATQDYQINHLAFLSLTQEGGEARNTVTLPLHEVQGEVQDGEWESSAREMFLSHQGVPLLHDYPKVKAIRSNYLKNVQLIRSFRILEKLHGKQLQITPKAGVVTAAHEVYSEAAADLENSIYVIGDLKAPVIEGMEVLEGVEIIEGGAGAFLLNLKAHDDLSGVREFYVEIYNTDNAMSKTWTTDENGRISINLTEESPIFAGDFTITAVAVDNVGNESRKEHQITEFALKTQVQRILAPHDPVFKRGESGLLSIATWGYVEKVEVEFAEELSALDESLNRTYTYDLPRYQQEEQQQFMIPLYVPEDGQYTITVRAYKGDKQLETYPETEVIDIRGTVLDEIRTRLR